MENTVKQKDSFIQVVFKKLKQLGKFIVDDCIKLPAYILTHPLKGFEEFKRYKKGKMSVAILFVVLTIFVNILKFQYDGFLVNDNNIKDLNTLAQVAYVAGAVVVVTIGNWAVTTLFDGKGKLGQVYMGTCYALAPYPLIQFPLMIFSNFVTVDEVGFYNMINVVSLVWAVFLIIFAMQQIHEFGPGKNILFTIASIFAMLVILFILMLFFSMISQGIAYFISLGKELLFRL